MKIVGVIPARLKSTRLDEKILSDIGGRPMIQHVWERASAASELDSLIVACDDLKVKERVESFGGNAVMTRSDHPNGTSRIAEVAANMDVDVLINIQGDEPGIEPGVIDALAKQFRADPTLAVATLAVPSHDEAVLNDPNVVKVVCDSQGYALYFSRAPIPFHRDKTSGSKHFLKHLGIYAYSKLFLLEFTEWQPSELELTEKLEQLRILENGKKIRVLETKYDSIGVDTKEDLEEIRKQLT